MERNQYRVLILILLQYCTIYQVASIMNGVSNSIPGKIASNLNFNNLEKIYNNTRPVSSVDYLLESQNRLDTNFETVDKTQHPDNFKIEVRSPSQVPGPSEMLYFIVTNDGQEDDYISVNISDDRGYVKRMASSETQFPLPIGSKKEIPVRIDFPLINGTVAEQSPDTITIQARGKRNTVTKRSIFFPGSDLEYGGQNAPFCYDRYVHGNCRYRTDPEYCFNYEWTAFAIIQNIGGYGTLRSIPEGLIVPPFVPGSRERVRVWVKTSCCVPYVQIISTESFGFTNNICVIDVRELQGLHPAEIAGIVIGAVLLLIIILVIVILLVRRRRAQTIMVGHHSRSRECISSRE